MPVCESCGTDIEPGKKFCSECGHPVIKPVAPLPSPPVPPEPQPAITASPLPPPHHVPVPPSLPAEGPEFPFRRIITAAVLLAAAAGIIFFIGLPLLQAQDTGGNLAAGNVPAPPATPLPGPSAVSSPVPENTTSEPSPVPASSLQFGTGCSHPDLTRCSGGCVDLRIDVGNCGTCGIVCPSGEDCENGQCVQPCINGLSLCSGYCRNLATDTDNCGMCGVACPSGQECGNGICVPSSCINGLSLCSGYCRDLATDPTNCGMCGVACPSGQKCRNGVCTGTGTGTGTGISTGSGTGCPGGLTNCQGTCVDTRTDTEHCGCCSYACKPGYTCRGGVCYSGMF